MIAIDTNVLVRLIVNDPSEQQQVNAARQLLLNNEKAYITQIVQVEVVWVLESAYQFNKQSVITVLEHLTNHPVYYIQEPERFKEATKKYQQNNVDFSDCLILAGSIHINCELYTFDRKLSKLEKAILVK